MGNKFCNLNIYCTAPIKVTHEIPQGHVYQCVDKWLTVTSPVFEWGNTQKYAKALSKSLSLPVLSTEYFDDDFVEFALYCCGKLVTKHIPVSYEDFKKKKGNAAKIIECLSLNILEEATLKKVLSVADCEESVYLLESYFGCPIFGIKDECPPTNTPDRTLFNLFAGRKSDVIVELKKNHAKVSEPPYAMEADDICVPSTILHETIICFTDKPEPIIRKIELWMKRLREDKEGHRSIYNHHSTKDHSDVLEGYDIRILLGRNRVIIHGLNYGYWDGDLSREFKSLTFTSLSGAENHFRVLECSMGYSGKLLFRASRGTAGTMEPEVIPNVILDSPFFSVADGELVASFEKPKIEEAIFALEELLGAPIHLIDPEKYQLIKSGDHLRVYK